MILSFAIVNNFGKARLLKFYRHYVRAASRAPPTPRAALTPRARARPQSEQQQQKFVRELFTTLTARSETASSFIDAAAWFEPGARVVYRQYATLYFCFVVDGSESELGILDLIQVLVEMLDRHFKNVCELDVIFNYEKVHWAIDEMIVGGLVVETNSAEILQAVEEQARLQRQQSDMGQAAAAAQSKLDQLTSAVNSLQRPGFDSS